MTISLPAAVQEALAFLEEEGLLLESDPELPSLTTMVAGEAVAGPWWKHRRNREIFAAVRALREHPDLACVRFLGGRATYIHRRRWNDLFAVATSGQPWQTGGLTKAARRLFEQVLAQGEVLTPDAAAAELEARLLVHGSPVNAEGGSDARALRSWERWAEEAGLRLRPVDSTAAKARFGLVLTGWGAPASRLPWI